jgi:hypothetical protein
MALTATEESLVRQLLDQQAAILSLAGNEATITSKLGATKVTLADLVTASAMADTDLMITRQGTTDKSVRADILAAYMAAELNLSSLAPKESPALTGDPTAPTPAQFDNDTSIATTAFVRNSGLSSSGYELVTTTQTLTAAHVGKSLNVSGAVTLTLPLGAGLPTGSMLQIVNAASASTVTLQRQGTETIQRGGSGVTSFALLPGESVQLYGYAGGWVVCGGSAASGDYGAFSSSKALSGYQKLPSGLIIQWGQSSVSTTASDVTLPVAFTTAALVAFATHIAAGDSVYAEASAASLTAVTLRCSLATSATINWCVFGY